MSYQEEEEQGYIAAMAKRNQGKSVDLVTMNIESFVAEAVLFSAQNYIAKHTLRVHPTIQVTELMGEQLAVRLDEHIYGRDISNTVVETTTVPRDWWQHFKLRWFPDWILRKKRWTVKWTQVETKLHHYHLCPHIPGANRNRHLQWMTTGDGTEYATPELRESGQRIV